jgi:hypothetical protein
VRCAKRGEILGFVSTQFIYSSKNYSGEKHK